MNLEIEALDVDMLQLLLQRGVALDPRADQFDPPMFLLGIGDTRRVAQNGKNASACISLLLQHGVRNSCLETGTTGMVGGDTFLMSIMRRGHDQVNYQIAKAVLEHGAPVDAVNDSGQTALMIAAGTGHKLRVRYVELLCDHGASVELEDKHGRTALRYAEKWGGHGDYTEVRRILQHASKGTRCAPHASSESVWTKKDKSPPKDSTQLATRTDNPPTARWPSKGRVICLIGLLAALVVRLLLRPSA